MTHETSIFEDALAIKKLSDEILDDKSTALQNAVTDLDEHTQASEGALVKEKLKEQFKIKSASRFNITDTNTFLRDADKSFKDAITGYRLGMVVECGERLFAWSGDSRRFYELEA